MGQSCLKLPGKGPSGYTKQAVDDLNKMCGDCSSRLSSKEVVSKVKGRVLPKFQGAQGLLRPNLLIQIRDATASLPSFEMFRLGVVSPHLPVAKKLHTFFVYDLLKAN